MLFRSVLEAPVLGQHWSEGVTGFGDCLSCSRKRVLDNHIKKGIIHELLKDERHQSNLEPM